MPVFLSALFDAGAALLVESALLAEVRAPRVPGLPGTGGYSVPGAPVRRIGVRTT